jgi:hypothetical protein
LRNVGAFFQVAIISSWGVTAYLPQPSPGKRQVSLGCLLGLLDEGVKDHNRLSSRGTEHRSANPFFASGTDLKQPFPQGTGKGHPQMGPNTCIRSVIRAYMARMPTGHAAMSCLTVSL